MTGTDPGSPGSPRWPVDPEGPTAPTRTQPRPTPSAASSAPPVVVRERAPWLVRLLFGLLAVLGLVVVLVLLLGRLVSLPDLNPFDEKTTDRSQPVLLKSVRDLARFTAAEGTFQVVIDSQRDRDNVPDFLVNDRTLFVASGTVEATVDFSALGKGAVTVVDKDTVKIKLPPPDLQRPSLDASKSYVYSQQRGLVNRLGDALGSGDDDQQELYSLAQKRIAAAATDAELTDRAETNTRSTLEGLMGSLGYDNVTVTFDGGADSR